jgi:hypothetical protein
LLGELAPSADKQVQRWQVVDRILPPKPLAIMDRSRLTGIS